MQTLQSFQHTYTIFYSIPTRFGLTRDHLQEMLSVDSSLISNYDTRVHLHPFLANIRGLLLHPLRCYVELELFWVTGFVYQISSPPSAQQLANTAEPQPHYSATPSPAACPGRRRFSGPLGCTQYELGSRNPIFTAQKP